MLKPLEQIKSVARSLDREELSLSTRAWYNVSTLLVCDCQHVGDYYTDKKYIKAYVRNSKSIQIWKYRKQREGLYNPRFYIELFQPDVETLNYINKFIKFTVPPSTCNSFNPTINQLEVAFDITTHAEAQRHEVNALINHHLCLKYARDGAVGSYETTEYRGKEGDVRAGKKGSRCYLKTVGGGDVCRLELQFNRQYLRENNFTIDSLPTLSADDFNLNDHLEFLDNFSDKGLWNISRTILRKHRFKAKSKRSHRLMIKMRSLRYRQLILGSRYGKIVHRVQQQIDFLKQLAKDKNITTEFKNYSASFSSFMEFLENKAATGYFITEKQVNSGDTVTVSSSAGNTSSFDTLAERVRFAAYDNFTERLLFFCSGPPL